MNPTSNHTGSREEHIEGVICDVTNCRYNNLDNCCTAHEIKVGPQFASTSYDTICATFKPD